MIKQLLQEGFVLKSKGYYKHAIEVFYKALEQDNKSYELLLEIADCYYLMKDEERALSYIEQVLEFEPNHIESLNLLKKIFLDKKAWNEAVQTLKNIYTVSHSQKDLAEILELLNKQKKYNEVIEYPIELTSPEILFEKACACLFSNDVKQAGEIVDNVLEKNPKDLKFLLLKGKILFKQGREDECASLLEIMDIDSNDSDMLNFAGLVKQQQGDYKKAISYFTSAINIDSKNDEYFYNCASTYFKMGDIILAKRFYNLAITMNPDNPSYHLALANLYYSEKQFRRALEELDYDFYEANLLKSLILFDSGYIALAKRGFLKLKEERDNDFVVDEYLNKIEEHLKIS